MTKITDPFLMLGRPDRVKPTSKGLVAQSGQGHAVRAHSKFSASGAERWFNCPGSVELSEGQPDKTSVYAQEGTQAHEVLEAFMLATLDYNPETEQNLHDILKRKPPEMLEHAKHATNVILELARETPDTEVLVETRIYLDFIHPEMFGTFDGAVVDHFGTLHVFDYKYGQGHAVAPGPRKPGETGNLQMIFYGIGLAHKFHWNFKRVRLWIIQPRIKNYQGPLFWDVSITELKGYVDLFRAAVKRVEESPDQYVEGSWCQWCKAKAVCPLKQDAKVEKAISIFSAANIRKVMAIEGGD